MFCPQCGQEYQDQIATCPECHVALVPEPPAATAKPEAEWVDLETVLETSNAALLTVARSLLEAEGIPCFSRGETVQEFMGWGRLPSGMNLITGPVQLQVPTSRSAEARDLLAAVNTSEIEQQPEDPTQG
jgi:putative signal transducing protein